MKHYCNADKKEYKNNKIEELEKMNIILFKKLNKIEKKEKKDQLLNIKNNNIIPLNKENLYTVLTKNHKLNILKSEREPYIEISYMIYNNDNYQNYRNIMISNLTSKFCKVYDNLIKNFITKSQKDIIKIYADNRIMDIKHIYDELKDELDDLTKNKIENLINNYNNNETINNEIKKELLCILYDNNSKVISIYKSLNKNT